MSDPVRDDHRHAPGRDEKRKNGSADSRPAPEPTRTTDQRPVSLPIDRLWTVRQAAAFLGRSVSWVYKAVERGELPRARGLGWGVRFVPADLHAFARGEPCPPVVVPVRNGRSD